MYKDIKLKNVKLKIDSDAYISKINDIVDEIKNITLKAKIIDMKKLELKKGFIVALKLKDDTGIITAILLGNRDDEFKNNLKTLNINDTYLIKGNTVILNDFTNKDLDIIKRINNFIKEGDMILAIWAIETINQGK